jgi:hypothetical protein
VGCNCICWLQGHNIERVVGIDYMQLAMEWAVGFGFSQGDIGYRYQRSSTVCDTHCFFIEKNKNALTSLEMVL